MTSILTFASLKTLKKVHCHSVLLSFLSRRPAFSEAEEDPRDLQQQRAQATLRVGRGEEAVEGLPRERRWGDGGGVGWLGLTLGFSKVFHDFHLKDGEKVTWSPTEASFKKTY